MRKIVVFDSGWGGEVIRNYVERRLPVEVEKVINWEDGVYGEKSAGEVRFLVEKALMPYIGRTGVIILAEQIVGVKAKGYLERKYPMQRFVAYERGAYSFREVCVALKLRGVDGEERRRIEV